MGVSAPVVLRLPPGHVHNYGFLLAHFTRLVGCEKQRLFSSWRPPGNSGRSSAIPARPSATVLAEGLGLDTARFLS
jgi:hypothetical protein